MNCGAASNDVADSGLEELPAALCDLLGKALKLDWKPKDFKKKGVKGKIAKAKMGGYDTSWVKSDKVYDGMNAGDWTNYYKCLAETSATDKSTAGCEVTAKNADGTASELWYEMKMGAFISNRDMHCTIKKYKFPEKLVLDEFKTDTVEVWTDKEKDAKESKKKTVRMKVVSFCFTQATDAGFQSIEIENYNFGGSLKASIVNSALGNAGDYEKIAGYLANIKTNGGKFKK